MRFAQRHVFFVLAVQLLAACAGEDALGDGDRADHDPGRKIPRDSGDEAHKLGLLKQARAALPKGALSRSVRGLTPQRGSDGIKRLRLPDHFEHASVAVVDEDGVVRSVCIGGAGEPSVAQDAP